jgi:radical SAM-linked protein
VSAEAPGSRARPKVRIRFTKLGKIRWTSHRDLARMWERAFRRVQLPLAYSEGFSPRPRVSFGLALPTGHESVAEYLDVELTGLDGINLGSEGPTGGLAARLSEALPVGVDATAVALLEEGTPSLQEDVVSCTWRWAVGTAPEADPLDAGWVSARVGSLLAASEAKVTRNRKGTEVVEDVRPGILTLTVEDQAEGVVLSADLAATPRAVRPAEVLLALGPGLEERNVRRTGQWILRQGERLEPLTAARDVAPPAPLAMERVS